MSGKPGERPFDAWSWVHAGTGAALAILQVPVLWAAILLVAYEGLEGLLRRVPGHNGKGLFEYESWPNVAADLFVAVLGYGIVWVLSPWRPPLWSGDPLAALAGP